MRRRQPVWRGLIPRPPETLRVPVPPDFQRPWTEHDWLTWLLSDDIRPGLVAVHHFWQLVDRQEQRLVAAAREQGYSWERIGDCLGLSRQHVHARWAPILGPARAEGPKRIVWRPDLRDG